MQHLRLFSFIHFNTTTDVVNFIQTGNVNLGRGNYPPQFCFFETVFIWTSQFFTEIKY